MPFVAIVDDDELLRTAFERLLRAAGFEARAFPCAEAFFNFASMRRPDCLLLDLELAGTSGLQIMQRMNASGIRIPTIVVSACDELATRNKCLCVGAAAYLIKPVDEPKLLREIAAALLKP